MRAYPINEDGEKIGQSRTFSAEHWERLLQIKGLRWREDKKENKAESIELIPNKTKAIEPIKTQTKKRRNK